MRCEVLKPFQATTHLLQIGEQVDTATWREANVQSLIERRYLKPVPEEGPVPLESTGSGPGRPRKSGR